MPYKTGVKISIVLRISSLAVILLVLQCSTGKAQSTQEVQFLPEIDAYLKLNPKIRISAQAKDTRERGRLQSGRDGPQHRFLRETPDQTQRNYPLRSGRCQNTATHSDSWLSLSFIPDFALDKSNSTLSDIAPSDKGSTPVNRQKPRRS